MSCESCVVYPLPCSWQQAASGKVPRAQHCIVSSGATATQMVPVSLPGPTCAARFSHLLLCCGTVLCPRGQLPGARSPLKGRSMGICKGGENLRNRALWRVALRAEMWVWFNPSPTGLCPNSQERQPRCTPQLPPP